MKKYVKPELIFESFEMTQQIAVCDFDLVESTLSDTTCAFEGELLPGDTKIIFLDGGKGCKITDIEDYCEHNGSSGTVIVFNS